MNTVRLVAASLPNPPSPSPRIPRPVESRHVRPSASELRWRRCDAGRGPRRPHDARGALERSVAAAVRSRRVAARRRRRMFVVAALCGLVMAAGHAGIALGGSSLAAPERPPQVVTHIVERGDTMWSIAGEIAPDRDPRSVVDALVEAHGSAALIPGQTLTWLD